MLLLNRFHSRQTLRFAAEILADLPTNCAEEPKIVRVRFFATRGKEKRLVLYKDLVRVSEDTLGYVCSVPRNRGQF